MSYETFKQKVSSEKVGLCIVEAVRPLVGWSVFSGSVYSISFTESPKITELKEGSTALTEASSNALSAGEWYFDRENRTLYVRASDSGDPDGDLVSATFQLFFSNVGIKAPHDLMEGFDVHWLPLLRSSSLFKSSVDNSVTQIGLAIESSGTVNFTNDFSFWKTRYDKYRFENQDILVYSYSRGIDVTEAQLIFRGQTKGTSYDSKSVRFSVANTIYQLRDAITLPPYSELGSYTHDTLGSISPRLTETTKQWLQRTVYGKVKGVVPVNIDRVFKDDLVERDNGNVGYPLGSVSVTNGSNSVNVGDRNFPHVSGGKILFAGDTSKLYEVHSVSTGVLTTVSLGENYGGTTGDTDAYLIPQKETDLMNRYFKVAGHPLSEHRTAVSTIVSQRYFYVDDASELEVGDNIVIFGGEGDVNRRSLKATGATGLSGTYVSIPNDSSLNETGTFSFACWHKSEVGDSFTPISAFASQWDPTGNDRGWYIGNASADKDRLRVILDSVGDLSTSYKDYYSSIDIRDNAWHLVGFTWNAGTLKIYIDGVEDTSVTKTNDDSFSAINSSANDLLLFGTGDGATNDSYEGTLNHLSYWDKVLTDDDWLEIYNVGEPANLNNHSASANLVSWWRGGGGSDTATSLVDVATAGNENNGTIVGPTRIRDVPNTVYARQIEQISDVNLIKLTAVTTDVVKQGWVVQRSGVQRVFIDDKELTEERDYIVDSQNALIILAGAGTGFDRPAEFNVADIYALNDADVEYSLASKAALDDSGTETTSFTSRLDFGDYLEHLDTTDGYSRVIHIFNDTLVGLEDFGSTASPSNVISQPKIKRLNLYQEGKTKITCEVRGKTDDGLTTGTLLSRAPDIVKSVLSDAGLSSITNTSSFTDASLLLPHDVGIVVPAKVNSSKSSNIRDVISEINRSVFGTLSLDSDLKFKYTLINPEKGSFETIDRSDVISFSIGSSSSNITSKIRVRYLPQEIDPSTLESSFQLEEFISLTASQSLGVDRILEVNTLLFSQVSAQEMASRWAFLLEQKTSIVKLRLKTIGMTISVGDVVKFTHPYLYDRFGSSDSERMGLVRSVSRTFTDSEIELDDLGNAFSRVATIAESGASDFSSATSSEKTKNGYITASNGLLGTDPETLGLNLIW